MRTAYFFFLTSLALLAVRGNSEELDAVVQTKAPAAAIADVSDDVETDVFFDDEILDAELNESEATSSQFLDSLSNAFEENVNTKLFEGENDIDADVYPTSAPESTYIDKATLTKEFDSASLSSSTPRRSIASAEPVPEPVGLSLLGMAMVFILMAYSIFRKQQEASFAAASDRS